MVIAALLTSVLGGLAGLAPGAASDPAEPPAAAKQAERVGGEAIGELIVKDGLFRCGPCLTDTKIPVGYPAPTAPGAIEIKHYPAVRRAEVTVPGGPGDERASNVAFFPLFNHISRNDIAMTAPVEMDFGTNEGGEPVATMSFLYEKPTDGPLDAGRGVVKVIDAEPVIVLALGVRGVLRGEKIREAVATLEGWVSKSPDWVSTGDYRWLGYNGPNIAPADRWFEVQLYIKPAVAVDAAAPVPTP